MLKLLKMPATVLQAFLIQQSAVFWFAFMNLGVQEIIVIGHHECGMAKTTSESLTKAMLSRGISADAIRMIQKDLNEWADEFKHPEENVKDAVAKIKTNPLIPEDIKVHGLMFHPRTGKLELIIKD